MAEEQEANIPEEVEPVIAEEPVEQEPVIPLDEVPVCARCGMPVTETSTGPSCTQCNNQSQPAVQSIADLPTDVVISSLTRRNMEKKIEICIARTIVAEPIKPIEDERIPVEEPISPIKREG